MFILVQKHFYSTIQSWSGSNVLHESVYLIIDDNIQPML